MAFQQRPLPARQVSFPTPAQPTEAPAVVASSPQRKRPLEDSQEWVLFSPTAAPPTTRTRTTSTDRTPRTAGLSRLSDFGSLDTAARSDQAGDDDDDDLTCQGTDPEEDGTELDSLDDGLHAFHEPSEHSSPLYRLDQSGGTVLPTHDGLGTFPASSAAVQEQLYQFERFNPRRKTRRRSSVQRRLDSLEEADELNVEDDRMQRIEKWRMEQSRALLEEIERETRRRRRMSRASIARPRADSAVSQDRAANVITETTVAADKAMDNPSDEVVATESLWQRFTRRVIRDLMGIDESVLSVIFGEALPTEATSSSTSTMSPSEQEQQVLSEQGSSLNSADSWEHRLLERIARELGILVHQLSEHPGAFSTYLRAQEAPLYPGLTPTAANTSSTSIEYSTSAAPHISDASPSGAFFAPTLPTRHSATYSEASLWGIEEEPATTQTATTHPPNPSHLQQEREYWERELDVKMVFNFLLRRFSSRPPSPDPTSSHHPPIPPVPGDPSTSAHTNPAAASARRAALIRQHHPLVSRTTDQRDGSRRKDLLHRHHYHHHHQPQPSLVRSRFSGRAGSSSCASQSTKKSKRSGSSRNYWDIGGSVGSAPAAGVGVWGEA